MHQSIDYALSQCLGKGERLLWSGRPRGGVRFRGQDIYIIPFSLLWAGFAFFWEYTAVTMTAKAPAPIGGVFPLFGAPFVLVGLYFVVGRFFADAYCRARTFYGVTNERIIILSGIFSKQTKSLQLRTLTDVSLTQRGDGSGTITFGPAHFMNAFFPAGSWPGAGRYAPPAFDFIDQAKAVYDIFQEAQKAAFVSA
ncbi:MAG TPA: PH domain-containing protein [Chthoniobacteraceae bacterium]